MVILYTSPGCASCRKAKQWLKDNQIEFIEKNIFTSLLKESEIKYLLSRCENGTEDIISVRSKAFQALKKDIDDYSMKELREKHDDLAKLFLSKYENLAEASDEFAKKAE